MENLPRRIREERLKLNRTLQQVSEKTGISKSFLSQVERGKVYPSIASLKKIAMEFGISVVSLFLDGGGEQSRNNLGHPPFGETERPKNHYVTDIKVVRPDKRKVMALPGSSVFYELLTPDLNRKMLSLYLHAKPGEKSGIEPNIDPPGEKFVLVIKGAIEVRLGSEVYQLKAGDSIYFPTDLPLYWVAKGEEPLEMIITMTPPWF